MSLMKQNHFLPLFFEAWQQNVAFNIKKKRTKPIYIKKQENMLHNQEEKLVENKNMIE